MKKSLYLNVLLDISNQKETIMPYFKQLFQLYTQVLSGYKGFIL